MEDSRVRVEKKPQTRQSTELFGIGPAICGDDATIAGIRLPTCMQVLRCMMYHCNAALEDERPGCLGAQSRFTTAKIVLKQVAEFYEKANIPMVTERRACEKIVKLLDDNNKLRSINKSRRDTPATLCKLESMQCALSSTFQLWPPNVKTLMTNDEDLAFLESMKGDRAASFGAFDKSLAKKIARRHSRDAAASERLNRSCSYIEASTATTYPKSVRSSFRSHTNDTWLQCRPQSMYMPA